MHTGEGRSVRSVGFESASAMGDTKGAQRYVRLGRGKFFLLHYRRGHHSIHLIRRVVNTYFDTRGSYRRTATKIDRELRYSRIYEIVDRPGENCKNLVDVAKELRPRWRGSSVSMERP
jgi:hypothetical protein